MEKRVIAMRICKSVLFQFSFARDIFVTSTTPRIPVARALPTDHDSFQPIQSIVSDGKRLHQGQARNVTLHQISDVRDGKLPGTGEIEGHGESRDDRLRHGRWCLQVRG